MFQRNKINVGALVVALACVAASIAPSSAAASDAQCDTDDVHCYGLAHSYPVVTGASAYQVTGWQKWSCQTPFDPPNDITAHAIWAAPSNSQDTAWAEFGITGGTFSNPPPPLAVVSYSWYVAVSDPAADRYEETIVTSYKPSRNVEYITTIRYDGADWRFFHGNNQVFTSSWPDRGYIKRADTGGEINDRRSSNTGSTSHLSRQAWGQTQTQAGWPNLIETAQAPFTASSVSTSSTAESQYNPTVGCGSW